MFCYLVLPLDLAPPPELRDAPPPLLPLDIELPLLVPRDIELPVLRVGVDVARVRDDVAGWREVVGRVVERVTPLFVPLD